MVIKVAIVAILPVADPTNAHPSVLPPTVALAWIRSPAPCALPMQIAKSAIPAAGAAYALEKVPDLVDREPDGSERDE